MDGRVTDLHKLPASFGLLGRTSRVLNGFSASCRRCLHSRGLRPRQRIPREALVDSSIGSVRPSWKSDRDLELTARGLDLSSHEVQQANDRLREELAARSRKAIESLRIVANDLISADNAHPCLQNWTTSTPCRD